MRNEGLTGVVKASLAFTLMSIPGLISSYSIFKRRFNRTSSLKNHILLGLSSSLTTSLMTTVCFIALHNLLSVYSGVWSLNQLAPIYILAYFVVALLMSGVGILVSGCLLGWLNFRATSSRK